MICETCANIFRMQQTPMTDGYRVRYPDPLSQPLVAQPIHCHAPSDYSHPITLTFCINQTGTCQAQPVFLIKYRGPTSRL